MDIYILREGKETGPFTEDATQSMLKQGAILINDLAWQPGMPNWLPLHAVLYPAAQPSAVRPPPPPDATPPPMPVAPELTPIATVAAPAKPPIALGMSSAASAQPVSTELATPRQKAFLSYMGIAFSSDLTREQAALLVNGTMENPKDTGRLQRWNEDRLRLHPDLFADEIKARKENRANFFHEVCQGEGAEFFEKVTKAHTQVLVGYLDVRFPNWDLREDDAKYSYFFPAIAEKFPQLLKKGVKGKFKYRDGPKVAPELARRSGGVTRPSTTSSPLSAMLRGVVFGAILLGLGFFAWSWKNSRPPASDAPPATKSETPSTGAIPTTQPRVTAPSVSPRPAVEPERPPPIADTNPPPVTTTDFPPNSIPAAELKTPGNMTASTAATPPNPVAKMDLFGTPEGAAPTAPPPKGVATVSNPFDPLAPTTAVPITPKEPVVPTGPPPRTTVKLTKPTTIALKFGSSAQRAGTVLPLVGVEGTTVKVKVGAEVVSIPASNTDINEGEPAPAAP